MYILNQVYLYPVSLFVEGRAHNNENSLCKLSVSTHVACYKLYGAYARKGILKYRENKPSCSSFLSKIMS